MWGISWRSERRKSEILVHLFLWLLPCKQWRVLPRSYSQSSCQSHNLLFPSPLPTCGGKTRPCCSTKGASLPLSSSASILTTSYKEPPSLISPQSKGVRRLSACECSKYILPGHWENWHLGKVLPNSSTFVDFYWVDGLSHREAHNCPAVQPGNILHAALPPNSNLNSSIIQSQKWFVLMLVNESMFYFSVWTLTNQGYALISLRLIQL